MMGVASLVLDALAPCTAGLSYIPGFVLGVLAVRGLRVAVKEPGDQRLPLIGFYSGVFGAALAAWNPFFFATAWYVYNLWFAPGVVT